MDASEDYNILLLDDAVVCLDEVSSINLEGNEEEVQQQQAQEDDKSCEDRKKSIAAGSLEALLASTSRENGHIETESYQVIFENSSTDEDRVDQLAPSLRNHITETTTNNQEEQPALSQDVLNQNDISKYYKYLVCLYCIQMLMVILDFISMFILVAKKILPGNYLRAISGCIDANILMLDAPSEKGLIILLVFILKTCIQFAWVLEALLSKQNYEYVIILTAYCIANMVPIFLLIARYNIMKRLHEHRRLTTDATTQNQQLIWDLEKRADRSDAILLILTCGDMFTIIILASRNNHIFLLMAGLICLCMCFCIWPKHWFLQKREILHMLIAFILKTCLQFAWILGPFKDDNEFVDILNFYCIYNLLIITLIISLYTTVKRLQEAQSFNGNVLASNLRLRRR